MAWSIWDLTSADITTALAAWPSVPDPSTTQITAWINQFAGPINAVVEGHGLSSAAITSSANVGLYYMFRGAVVARVIGEWFLANQQEGTTYYDAQVAHYQGVIEWISGESFKIFLAGQHGQKPVARDATKASSRVDPFWVSQGGWGT